MRLVSLMVLVFFLACKQKTVEHSQRHQDTAVSSKDTEIITASYSSQDSADIISNEAIDNPEVYSNKRFRNVTLTRNAAGDYVVKGEGQIFEANFGWVIEDGHKELKQGYAMTDAGAPEWGSFKFTVNSVNKITAGKKFHLILFETSAMDGSRQYELPIPLPD